MITPVITTHAEYVEAKNAYYNNQSYKGLSGTALQKAIFDFNDPSSAQFFGKTEFAGSRVNKATL